MSEQKKPPSTAIDALIFELLGDVGLVHAQIKSMRTELPQIELAIRQAGTDASMAIEKAGTKSALCIEKSVENALLKNPSAFTPRLVLSLAALCLLGALGGATLSYFYVDYSKNKQEALELAAGRDFIRVFPRLDDKTRNRIIDLIKTGESH